MPVLKTPSGFQVVSIDGEPMSRDNLTHEEAQKKEKELGEQRPLKIWARVRGILKKP